LTVVDPQCAHIALKVTPIGSLPFGQLQASVDGKPGTFALSFGVNQFDSQAATYTVHFYPPAGYGATPNPLTFTTSCNATASVEVTVAALDTTPPALTLPANIITPATSPSGAVVTFSATAVDAVDGAVPVTCVPPSGSLFAPGTTTTVSCWASDAHGNSVTGTFTVRVLGAAEIIRQLIADSVALQQGQNLLNNALASINRGDMGKACSQVGAFIDQVQTQTGKKVTQADAAHFIGLAQGARAALGCG